MWAALARGAVLFWLSRFDLVSSGLDQFQQHITGRGRKHLPYMGVGDVLYGSLPTLWQMTRGMSHTGCQHNSRALLAVTFAWHVFKPSLFTIIKKMTLITCRCPECFVCHLLITLTGMGWDVPDIEYVKWKEYAPLFFLAIANPSNELSTCSS